MKKYDSLIDALDDLKSRGFSADLEPPSNCLYCSNLDLRLNEEEFKVDEVYRIGEGASPADNGVVYALTSPTGVKGTIIDGFGISS
ncbi:MAG TPA: hypothetical protein VK666_01550 [Chryseolinea sp.]|nr:hypothetical protein [Chryseolinea sp.]